MTNGQEEEPAYLPQERFERKLNQIEAVSKNARGTWISLIAILLFSVIAVAGVHDRDYYTFDAALVLPIAGVSVPIRSFFLVGPTIILGLYIYLHLYLIKLWRALASVDAQPSKGSWLDDMVFPWLISDAAIYLKPGAPKRPFGWLTQFVSFMFLWMAAPVVLMLFWFRSFPPHDAWLTTWVGALVSLSILGGITSFVLWFIILRAEGEINSKVELNEKFRQILPIWGIVACVILIEGWTKSAGGLQTDGLKLGDPGRIYSANLSRTEFVERPTNWKPHDEAWEEFKAQFARASRKELLEKSSLDEIWILEAQKSFQKQRQEELETLRIDDFIGRDFRNADLSYAFLPGIDLSNSDLRGANFSFAEIEGITISGARMEGINFSGLDLKRFSFNNENLRGAVFNFADLKWVNLQEVSLQAAFLKNADLSGARLQLANLLQADLRGADLSGARLHRANLQQADLRRADLTLANLNEANLQQANLWEANLQKATLRRASLSEALLEGASLQTANLWQADLKRAFLLQANLQGAMLEGANLSKASLRQTNLQSAKLEGASLSDAILEGALLDKADLWQANLSRADLKSASLLWVNLSDASLPQAVLERANLWEANLRSADLRAANLQQANLTGADLRGADVRNASFQFAMLASANLDGTLNLTQSQINSAFGNSATKLPANLEHPAHWPAIEFANEDVLENWRVWVEAELKKLHKGDSNSGNSATP